MSIRVLRAVVPVLCAALVFSGCATVVPAGSTSAAPASWAGAAPAGQADAAAVPAATPAATPGATETFGGVGASLQADGRYAKVAALLPDGAAAQSGQLQLGERVIGVGEQSGEIANVIGLPLANVVGRIRGPSGSQVRLQVLPAGTDDLARARVVTLVRASITAPKPVAVAAPVSAVPVAGGAPAAASTAADVATECAEKLAAIKACEQVPFPGNLACKAVARQKFSNPVCAVIQ